jgi:hypothetical protein
MPERKPISALLSYWKGREAKEFEQYSASMKEAEARGRSFRLLIDSGAFSADSLGFEIHPKDYAAWLDIADKAWGSNIVGKINLDVLGDAKTSWKNWQKLRDLGHDTMPVLHLGHDPKLLEPYLKEGSRYVALGAMVRKSLPRKFRWAAHVHRWARDHHPDVRIHGLGVSAQKIVESLPWFSIDSSSGSAAYRFGRAHLFDPRTRKMETISLNDPKDVYAAREILRRFYGIDPSKITFSSMANRALLCYLIGKTHELWEEDLHKRRPIPPPPGLTEPGTHLHHVLFGPDLLMLASDEGAPS